MLIVNGGEELVRDYRIPTTLERANFFEHSLGDYLLLLTLDLGYTIQSDENSGVGSAGFFIIDAGHNSLYKKWVTN